MKYTELAKQYVKRKWGWTKETNIYSWEAEIIEFGKYLDRKERNNKA